MVRVYILAKDLMICWYLAIPHLEQVIILDKNVIISILLESKHLLSSAEVPMMSKIYTQKKSCNIILPDYHRNLISIQRTKHQNLSFLKNKDETNNNPPPNKMTFYLSCPIPPHSYFLPYTN